MTSVAQLQANRLNAQRSTGPRTEAGKAASRFNALKFGAEARSLVLPSEDAAELALLATEYHQQFNPIGPLEDYLVQTLVQADWMRRRYTLVESLIVQSRVASPDQTTLDAFTCPAAQQIFRRLAAEGRSYFRALKELRRAQRERRAEEENAGNAANAASEPAQASSPAPASPEAPQNGFVSPISAPPDARPSHPAPMNVSLRSDSPAEPSGIWAAKLS
jgi:hypothetical protein